RLEDEPEDEPERHDRKQRIEEQPAIAEQVLPRRPAHLGSGFGQDEMPTVPQRRKITAQTRASTDGDESLARDGGNRTQAERIRGLARALRLTHFASAPVSWE